MKKIRIVLIIGIAIILLTARPSYGQNCDVDFPGKSSRTFRSSCGGSTCANLTLGKNISMGDGDTFTFDAPVINISGNIDVNAEGSAKIIIPAGVTVNLGGNFQLDPKNLGCSTGNPCTFEIVVNGTANLTHNFQSRLVTLIWSGTGTVIVADNFKNSSDGCMTCGGTGCPNFNVNQSECKDDGVGCVGGDICSKICASDTTNPIITGCPSNQVVNLTGPACTQPVSWDVPVASDNCRMSKLTSTHNPGSTFVKGTTTVTYTATDAAGNTSTCSFNVTVIDDLAPVIIGCPADITVNAGSACEAVVTWSPPTFTDNCPKGTLTTNKEPGSTFAKGTTIVNYIAVDSAGNVSTCSFNVNVIDNVAPVITNCPANITVNASDACQGVATWNAPTFTDNCSVTMSATHNSGDVFPFGKTEVTYTATDGTGNFSECTFFVVIKNESLPVIMNCPDDILLQANAEGTASASWIEPTASVSCGEVTMKKSHQPGGSFGPGSTRVEYTFSNASGGSSICNFDIIVSAFAIEIEVSKIITPDGDGVNDEWLLINVDKFKDCKVLVYDRWGSPIFEGSGYDNENVVWRGTNRSGNVVPNGTYFYSIKIDNGSSRFEKTGFIELVR